MSPPPHRRPRLIVAFTSSPILHSRDSHEHPLHRRLLRHLRPYGNVAGMGRTLEQNPGLPLLPLPQ